MHILAELTPFDPVTDTRPTVRASSAQLREITGLNGQKWWPAISVVPAKAIRLFDGDFTSDVDPGDASLTLLVDKLAKVETNVRRYLWAGARLTIYSGEVIDAWPWTTEFKGLVERFEASGNQLKLSAKVDTEPFEANALTANYAGTGGAEGDANLKNRPKPWLFGRCLSVEPVMINSVDNVFQFSAYGPIQAVNALYERAADFGASVGDYASYALLVAATIPAGRWGTCFAEGLIRLGAPPFGVITGDVDGDKPSGTWLRKTGEIINRIATHSGVSSGLIDSASLTALDTALTTLLPNDGKIGLFLDDQVSVIDIARRLARPCNAQAGISWAGKLFVVRVAIGTPALTLDAQGRRLPGVIASTEVDVSPPYWRIEMGAQRAWRVHTFAEIATSDPLVDRGVYSGSETYRAGNIVQDQGATWLYINATAGAGNAPPTLPTTSNAWWRIMATPGLNQATVSLYQRNATGVAPTAPAADTTYTFATGILSGTLGSWTQAVPAASGGAFLFVTQARAIGSGLTDTIVPGDWSAVVLHTQGLSSDDIATLEALVDDNVLAIDEKTRTGGLLAKLAELGDLYTQLTARAAALGLPTTSVAAARTAFVTTYLGALSPPYDDIENDTPLATDLGVPLASFTNSGADLAANGAWQTITDNSAAAQESRYELFTVTPSASYSIGFEVKKDAVAGATRAPLILLGSNNGTAKNGSINLDTATGAFIATGTATASGVYALDDNTWLVWITLAMPSNTTQAVLQITPAYGVYGGSANSVQGSIDAHDPVVVLGAFDKLGRAAFKYRLKTYAAALELLARYINEASAQTQGNALNRNASFELMVDGIFPGWAITLGTGAAVTQGTAVAKRGVKSARLSKFCELIGDRIAATAGETIFLSAGWKTITNDTAGANQGAGRWYIGLLCYNSAGSNFSNVWTIAEDTPYTVAQGYQEKTAPQVLPANTVEYAMAVFFEYSDNSTNAVGEIDFFETSRAESGANVGRQVVPEKPTITIPANYDGTIPSYVGASTPVRLLVQGTVVTAGITWSYVVKSGNVNGFDSTSGSQSLSGAGSTSFAVTDLDTDKAVVEVSALQNGVTEKGTIEIVKDPALPPTSGGGGGGTAGDSTFTNTTSNSYGAANGGPIIVTAGAAGSVTLNAPLDVMLITPSTGTRHAFGKFQWRVVAGSWADVAAETQTDIPAKVLVDGEGQPSIEPGNLPLSRQKTGLTTGVDYEFQVLLRNNNTSTELAYAGNFTAVAD